jgi:branched-chain amino acid transport system substrate-binding protein
MGTVGPTAPDSTVKEEETMKGKALWTAWLLVLCFLASPAGPAFAAGGEKGSLKIALLFPFTGLGADHGKPAEEGVRMRLEEAGWQVAGKKLEFLSSDEDVMDPSVTLSRVKKLVESDKIDILIGPLFGSSQQAVAPYLTQNGVTVMGVHNGAWELGVAGNFFVWPSCDYSMALPLGDYAYKDLGYRKLSIIAPDYIFGHSLLGGPADLFKKLGGQVIQEQWVPLGTKDLLPYITSLNKEADALMIWLVPEDMGNFLKHYESMKVNKPVLMIHFMRHEMLQEIGPIIEGKHSIVDYTWRLQTPENQAFVKNFEKIYGRHPDSTNANAYAVASAVLKALETNGGNASLSAMKEALLKVRFGTPIGEASFAPSGFAVCNRFVVEVKKVNGEYVYEPVKTYMQVKDPREK